MGCIRERSLPSLSSSIYPRSESSECVRAFQNKGPFPALRQMSQRSNNRELTDSDSRTNRHPARLVVSGCRFLIRSRFDSNHLESSAHQMCTLCLVQETSLSLSISYCSEANLPAISPVGSKTWRRRGSFQIAHCSRTGTHGRRGMHRGAVPGYISIKNAMDCCDSWCHTANGRMEARMLHVERVPGYAPLS